MESEEQDQRMSAFHRNEASLTRCTHFRSAKVRRQDFTLRNVVTLVMVEKTVNKPFHARNPVCDLFTVGEVVL